MNAEQMVKLELQRVRIANPAYMAQAERAAAQANYELLKAVRVEAMQHRV